MAIKLSKFEPEADTISGDWEEMLEAFLKASPKVQYSFYMEKSH